MIKNTLSAILILAMFLVVGCAPATKATLNAAKGPVKNYVIKSVDSGFITSEDYIILYTTVNKKKKDVVQIASFKVRKTGTEGALTFYEPFGTMTNDTYKKAAKGEITKKLKVTRSTGDVFDGSGEPAILIESNLPNKRVLLSIYAHPDDDEWGKYSIALEPRVKVRRPYMYGLVPATVAADAAVTSAVVAGAVVGGVVFLIYAGGRLIF